VSGCHTIASGWLDRRGSGFFLEDARSLFISRPSPSMILPGASSSPPRVVSVSRAFLPVPLRGFRVSFSVPQYPFNLRAGARHKNPVFRRTSLTDLDVAGFTDKDPSSMKASLLSPLSVPEPRCLNSVCSLTSFCADGNLDYVQHRFERKWFFWQGVRAIHLGQLSNRSV
jgi:hypothetical protein